MREDGGHGRVFRGVRAYVQTSLRVFRGEPLVRRFLIANAAWEGTFAAARTFVVLYVSSGLGSRSRSRRSSSLRLRAATSSLPSSRAPWVGGWGSRG